MANPSAWVEGSPGQRFGSNVFKKVYASYTSNTLAAAWTPATGKKFRLKGGLIMVSCTTICAGSEVAGNLLALMDSTADKCVVPIATLMSDDIAIGSQFPGIQGHDAAVLAATSFAGAAQPGAWRFDLGEGYVSETANNVLKFGLISAAGAAVTVSTGVLVLSGLLWGTEQ